MVYSNEGAQEGEAAIDGSQILKQEMLMGFHWERKNFPVIVVLHSRHLTTARVVAVASPLIAYFYNRSFLPIKKKNESEALPLEDSG